MSAPASALVYPLPTLTTQQAAQRLWTIRQLLRERALDEQAALTSLERLARHPNARIASLAAYTECDVSDHIVDRLHLRQENA